MAKQNTYQIYFAILKKTWVYSPKWRNPIV